jgi:hypothetical protein
MALTCAFAPRADAFIYWANNGEAGDGTTIGRANNDGTSVDQSFLTGLNEPCGVAVDGQHIYWANRGTNSIGRANLDGSGVQKNFIPVVGQQNPCAPAVSSTRIWWANFGNFASDDGSIARANLNGSGVEPNLIPTAPQVNRPCGIALNSQFAYWTNAVGSPNPTIWRSPVGDPFPELLVGDSGNELSCWPSVSGSHIYWANFTLALVRDDLDPGTPANPELVVDANAVGGTAIHGGKVYFANNTEGTISSANLDGSAPNFAFIRGGDRPFGLAVDSGHTPPAPPCSDFTFGKAKKNKKKGTAKLPVEVDCAGALELAGKGLKPSSADASGAGEVKLKVKAKGKAKKKLRKKGKKKFEPSVTFTPAGGAANTEDTKVKLVKK